MNQRHLKELPRKITSINENETDAESVPYIEKLEYEIETFGGDIQQTLGSLGWSFCTN